MSDRKAQAATVKASMAALSALCDSGYALAIHIRLTRPSLLSQTYAAEWSDTYSTKGYHLSDPVVMWGLANTGWVEWASLISADKAGVIPDAIAHGLHNGWTYATGPAASRTIAGITRRSAPFTEADRAQIARLVDDIHSATDGIAHWPQQELDRFRKLM